MGYGLCFASPILRGRRVKRLAYLSSNTAETRKKTFSIPASIEGGASWVISAIPWAMYPPEWDTPSLDDTQITGPRVLPDTEASFSAFALASRNANSRPRG